MFKRIKCADRDDWLQKRKNGIGGSDAATIIGENPWKTNETLWLEKTGQLESEDISNNEAVRYGIQAESILRRLFKLDFPEYKVRYRDNELLQNTQHPWMQASLDGELVDAKGRNGILEIKTTTINRSMQKEKWRDQVPQNYYCQLLHYFLVTGYEFAVLKAQLKSYWKDNEVRITTKHYYFEASECIEDMKYLFEAEQEFWQQVQSKERPALLLPVI